MNTLRSLLVWSLPAVFYIGFSPIRSSSDEPAGVKVFAERVERMSRDEVHFSVKIANGSDSPVFLPGTDFETPDPHLLFLEQWREKGGWKTVVPCLDVPPPHVIKLGPGGAITLDRVLKLPFLGVCKERNIQLEGRFRFRLDYFRSKKQARTYVKQMFSDDWQRAQAEAEAVSEPFEIPPPKS